MTQTEIICPRETNMHIFTKPLHQYLWLLHSQTPHMWKNTNIHQLKNGYTNCWMSIQWRIYKIKSNNTGKSQSILLTEIRQTHKAIDCMIPFLCSCENDKNIETKKQINGCKSTRLGITDYKGSWRKYCDYGKFLYLDLDCGYLNSSWEHTNFKSINVTNWWGKS